MLTWTHEKLVTKMGRLICERPYLDRTEMITSRQHRPSLTITSSLWRRETSWVRCRIRHPGTVVHMSCRHPGIRKAS